MDPEYTPHNTPIPIRPFHELNYYVMTGWPTHPVILDTGKYEQLSNMRLIHQRTQNVLVVAAFSEARAFESYNNLMEYMHTTKWR